MAVLVAAGFQTLPTPRLESRRLDRHTRMAFGRRPPQEVLDQLQPGWRNDFVGTPAEISAMWSAFETVYAGREAALAAFRKNSQVLLPIVNSPDTILGAHRVLVELFGAAEAAQIIARHPGILACAPSSLARTSKQDIRRTARLVAGVNSLPAELKAGIPTVTAFALVGGIGTRAVQCGGGRCADANAWLPDGGFGPEPVRAVSQLVPHLPGSG